MASKHLTVLQSLSKSVNPDYCVKKINHYDCLRYNFLNMSHFICKGGCGGVSEIDGFCETDGCSNQWQPLEDCNCLDGKHFVKNDEVGVKQITKDSNGNEIHDGDSVVLIKDLPLRGSSAVYKRGTKVTNVKLTDNFEEIDCRIEGSEIVLKTCFLKKV